MFSGIVKIAEIDDYIKPSQNCIKPLMEIVGNSQGAQSKIQIGEDGQETMPYTKPDLIKIKNQNSRTAKVSLNDCLACNGCVTTAETLLIQAQSVQEFVKNSSSGNYISIACISPQSVMSLANYFTISHIEALKRLLYVFAQVGVNYVFNFNTAIDLVLLLSYEEFKKNIQSSNKVKNILCSECPGWVCYAEKKIGEWIIPHMSKIKSPQQIFGHVIKTLFTNLSKNGKEVYVCCVMPCYDKKLEAARNQKEVDTVMSTIELLDLFSKIGVEFEKFGTTEVVGGLLCDFASIAEFLKLSKESGDPQIDFEQFLKQKVYTEADYQIYFEARDSFSSNGYTEYILHHYIEEFFISQNKNYSIQTKICKNSDYKEIFLYSDPLQLQLSFCQVYGFRNIQNLIRKFKQLNYDYVEIMACPGGCINGGGQLPPSLGNDTSRSVLKNITDTSTIELEKYYEYLKQKTKTEVNFLLEIMNTLDTNPQGYHTIEFKALNKNSIDLNW